MPIKPLLIFDVTLQHIVIHEPFKLKCGLKGQKTLKTTAV